MTEIIEGVVVAKRQEQYKGGVNKGKQYWKLTVSTSDGKSKILSGEAGEDIKYELGDHIQAQVNVINLDNGGHFNKIFSHKRIESDIPPQSSGSPEGASQGSFSQLWTDKVVYLNALPGAAISGFQNNFNDKGKAYCFATQIFPCGLDEFSAFIYMRVLTSNLAVIEHQIIKCIQNLSGVKQ